MGIKVSKKLTVRQNNEFQELSPVLYIVLAIKLRELD